MPDERRQEAEIKWPPAWFGLHGWELVELVKVLTHEASGDQVFVAGGVLTDGCNLIGLVSKQTGAQNVARCGPATQWSIEERVDPKMPAYCRSIWRQVIESLIYGRNAAEAELGSPLA